MKMIFPFREFVIFGASALADASFRANTPSHSTLFALKTKQEEKKSKIKIQAIVFRSACSRGEAYSPAAK